MTQLPLLYSPSSQLPRPRRRVCDLPVSERPLYRLEQHGTAALVVDDDEKTLVYLEMVRHKQAVKANWAALMNGSRQLHYLGGCYIRQEGMKQHIHLKSSLPCGWANHILLHKQTSLKTMNPEHPFYLLDDGTQPIPPCSMPCSTNAWHSPCWKAGQVICG